MAPLPLPSPEGNKIGRRQSPLLGFSCPHGDFSSASPLIPGLPTFPVRAALRLSQPLDGLLLAKPCGLVSCRCHLKGFTLQGVSPPSSSQSSSEWLYPHGVSLTGTPRIPASWVTLGPEQARLQGVAPHDGPSSLLGCYTLQGLDPLMGFHASPRSSLLLPRSRFRSSSAHGLGLGADSEEPVLSADLQRLDEQEARLASFESCRPA
jgi:hypothetical protein